MNGAQPVPGIPGTSVVCARAYYHTTERGMQTTFIFHFKFFKELNVF